MKYLERSPSPRLAEYVKCFWSLEDLQTPDGEQSEPVVPDGCIEIIFNLSDRFRRYHANGEIELQPSSIVAGQIETNILIGPSGDVRLFGIRFKAAGAFPFFDLEMNALANRIEPLDTVWGSSVPEIEERLWFAATFEEQIAVAEAALADRFSACLAIDPWVTKAVASISSQNGSTKVQKIAKDIGISERGLERRFNRYVGLSPKAFSRIIRFQGVLRALESAERPDILDTAHQFGYYDQSHLINDFRQYAGLSPGAFAERSHGITELFIASE